MLQSPGQDTTSKLISAMVNVTNRTQGMFTVTNTMVNSTLVQLLTKKENKNTKEAPNQVVLKFQHTIKLHGFDNFKYKVLQTTKYSNICEMWELVSTESDDEETPGESDNRSWCTAVRRHCTDWYEI